MKVLVLSSGGIDSTTALGMAVNKYGKKMLFRFLFLMDKSIIKN